MKLRHENFAKAYVDNGGNVSEALRTAGYKPSHNNHTRLMSNPSISGLIRKLVDERYTLTKEQYENRTLDLHKQATNEHVSKAYWELLGKVKGFITPDSTNITIASIGEKELDNIRNRRLQVPSSKEPIVSSNDVLNTEHT